MPRHVNQEQLKWSQHKGNGNPVTVCRGAARKMWLVLLRAWGQGFRL